jgi:hypothetical protein
MHSKRWGVLGKISTRVNCRLAFLLSSLKLLRGSAAIAISMRQQISV